MHTRAARRAIALGMLWTCMAGCEVDAEERATPDAAADAPDSARVDRLDLPWPAQALAVPPVPADNPPSEAKRLLGRELFYDPILSRDRATACVTCHSEIWGLGDQLARSVGVEGVGRIGPGRTGPHTTRRNAQALWNVAYRSQLFWDGRTGSLESQVFFPLESQDELARDPDEVIAELSAIPVYVEHFRAAFPGAEPPVSRDTMSKALATFMRAYVSDRATYDQYIAGDARALSEQDLRGLRVFAQLGCHDCHVPPRFDSERYAARHVPDPDGIEDLGRYEVTGNESERGAFRVPTLRNARETGPYFHNGAVTSFDDAVQHEVDEQRALTGHPAPSADEQEDLTQFLRRALSDTSRKQHPPDAVPSGLSIPLDGDRFLRGTSGE